MASLKETLSVNCSRWLSSMPCESLSVAKASSDRRDASTLPTKIGRSTGKSSKRQRRSKKKGWFDSRSICCQSSTCRARCMWRAWGRVQPPCSGKSRSRPSCEPTPTGTRSKLIRWLWSPSQRRQQGWLRLNTSWKWLHYKTVAKRLPLLTSWSRSLRSKTSSTRRIVLRRSTCYCLKESRWSESLESSQRVVQRALTSRLCTRLINRIRRRQDRRMTKMTLATVTKRTYLISQKRMLIKRWAKLKISQRNFMTGVQSVKATGSKSSSKK